MKNDHTYQAWLAARRASSAGIDLTDAIMERLEAEREQECAEVPVWKSPLFWAKAALFIVAAVAGPGRYILLIFCLFIN